MKSPLSRVIVATLGGYIILMLIWFLYDWIREEFPTPPETLEPLERVQHPYHHSRAVKAMEWFFDLSEQQQVQVKTTLTSRLISPEKWIGRLNEDQLQLICLGELHQEATRRFIAQEIFSRLKTDILLLEATSREAVALLKRFDSGRHYYPLLDADIMSVLRSVKLKNPDAQIVGIEQTYQQQKRLCSATGSREKAITANFRDVFQPGRRHVILFGTLHCAKEPDWLYYNIYKILQPEGKHSMIAVSVLGEHDNGSLEAFIYFLDEIGIKSQAFVIENPESLTSPMAVLFPELFESVFSRYDAVVVFRS